jgi:hypothetical protein
MAKVTIQTGEVSLGLQDVVFRARGTGGKIGELHISRGSVDWWPRGIHTKAIRLSWQRFADVLEEHRSNVQRSRGRAPRKTPRR